MNAKQIFTCLFILASIAHIALILLKKEKLRKLSKICVMPLLLCVYISGAPDLRALPAAALIFGWAGDILLIRIGRRSHFMLGLLSFLIGHICYAAAIIASFGSAGFLRFSGSANIPATAVYIIASVFSGLISFRIVKPNKKMFIPVAAYTVVIIFLSFCGFQLMMFRQDFAASLIFAGCISFMVSDTMVGYFTFRKLKLWGSVLIMVTYIAAQAGIICGFMGF